MLAWRQVPGQDILVQRNAIRPRIGIKVAPQALFQVLELLQSVTTLASESIQPHEADVCFLVSRLSGQRLFQISDGLRVVACAFMLGSQSPQE